MPAKYLSLLFFGLALASLIGCGSALRQAGESETPFEDPQSAVDRLEEEIDGARQRQVHLLSPRHFESANEAYLTAGGELDRGAEIHDIMTQVRIARDKLKLAEKAAATSRKTLPQVIESRRMARKAGATRFEDDYADVERRFLQLTRAIEKGNLQYAKRKASDVGAAFRELELRAIKDEVLSTVRQTLVNAAEADAGKYAPQALALAKKHLNEAETFISNNRYALAAMQTRAAEALFMAQRALVLARHGRRFKEMTPEKTALWMESLLHQISVELPERDLRNRSFETQAQLIVTAIKTLESKTAALTKRLDQKQKEGDALKAAITSLERDLAEQRQAYQRLVKQRQTIERRLSAERQFQRLFSEVQQMFLSDEAEVYKQGNKLVIRVKAIQFPIGQAILVPDNYPLLGKIQQAIKAFDQPSVIVEGHTDSSGSDEINQYLSQQRADAVRQYLLANQIIPRHKIAAIGYGSQKPVALNTTPEGRALNRRIDVIITPGEASLQ